MNLALEMVGKPLLWVLGMLLAVAKGRDVCSGDPQEAKSYLSQKQHGAGPTCS